MKLLQGGGWSWGVLLGVSFGLGMLAKYAMIYFVLGVAGAALIDRDARALLRSPALWLAARDRRGALIAAQCHLEHAATASSR